MAQEGNHIYVYVHTKQSDKTRWHYMCKYIYVTYGVRKYIDDFAETRIVLRISHISYEKYCSLCGLTQGRRLCECWTKKKISTFIGGKILNLSIVSIC